MNIRFRPPIIFFSVFILIAPWLLNDHQTVLLETIAIYSIAAFGLVLLTGISGMTSFSQAAFMGVGAYASAWLTTTAADSVLSSPWLGLVFGLTIALILACFIGLLTVRLSGHFLPLATIAWGISLYHLFKSVPFLGKEDGITDVPPLSLAGYSIDSLPGRYYFIWALTLLLLISIQHLLRSRPGRAMHALQGGVQMAESMGVHTTSLKLIVFIFSSLLAATAGWLYVHQAKYVSATPFNLNWGIEILFMVVLGGSRSVWGAIIGASFIILMKDQIQNILLIETFQNLGNFETIVFGALVILFLQRSSGGLLPLLQRWVPRRKTAATNPATMKQPALALPRKPMPPAGSTVLEGKAVSKHFGGLKANQNLDLTLRAAEIVALIGPNGAGKSTFFNVLSGVYRPTSGSVSILNHSHFPAGARDFAKSRLSRSFQHVKLQKELTVLENAAMGAYLRQQKGIIKEIVSALFFCNTHREAAILQEAAFQLERVGLGDHLYDKAGTLPLGKQRILEIARALSSDPYILLLDEPAAGLRLPEKQALAEVLQHLRAEGMAILLVEHDMEFVMQLANTIIVMEFGEKIAEGTPSEIQNNPRVLEAYLGA